MHVAGLRRAAARRAVRPDPAQPDRHGHPGHHRGPQAGRGRRELTCTSRRPSYRKFRAAIYPVRTPQRLPAGFYEARRARIEQARAEQQAGDQPAQPDLPQPQVRHWRSSNFARRVLAPAYLAAGWRDPHGGGDWTWHSLRHVFCTTALFTWKLDATDVSAMAGHANYRITLDMYVGTTAGVLDRARQATQ